MLCEILMNLYIGETSEQKNSLFYVEYIQQNAYLYSCVHHGGCNRISRAKTFGDFGACGVQIWNVYRGDF